MRIILCSLVVRIGIKVSVLRIPGYQGFYENFMKEIKWRSLQRSGSPVAFRIFINLFM